MSRADPFVGAIETMKHSVASLDCLEGSGTEAKIVERPGSAFLISEAGDFVTAAHVILAIEKGDYPCPTSAILFPAGDWSPENYTEQMRSFPFKTSDCRADTALDIAVCPLSQDLSARRSKLHLRVEPVHFEWNIPPDGTHLRDFLFGPATRDFPGQCGGLLDTLGR
jgi:hypothetical protein